MTRSRASTSFVSLAVSFLAFVPIVSRGADLPPEKPLWTDGETEGRITYEEETVRSPQPPAGSPSGSNRVFSYVSKPTYSIHRAPKSAANGVGLVICPGGGYRDVWLDREGHDLALWLTERGVTSLVLKYRTNSGGRDDQRKYSWEDYLPAVEADARQAIRVLRRQAPSLGVDPSKIGICGFSAGGHLALIVSLFPERGAGTKDVSGAPDFAGLFYPWLRDEYASDIEKNAASIPPLFIMNAREDRATPAPRCVEFYAQLLSSGVRCELHVYEKGGHGFDLGNGRGASTALWKTSFVAWLRDAGFAAGR